MSSVQDELINERTAILELVNTDSFLSRHVEKVMTLFQQIRDSKKGLLQRGMIWFDSKHNTYRPTAAGLLMFGQSPDAAFPQSRIAANAYSGTSKEDLIDRSDIRKPFPSAIEDAIQLLIRNMGHITKTQSFSRVVIDEYPYDALREAIVNAVAHRDYGIRGASIRIEKYSNRLQILSPGGPPPPITMSKIRSLNYTPCSRNPTARR